MEIRTVRESEVEQMIELMCLVFRPQGHERYRQYMVGDPLYQRDQSRVVVVDGRIVATLRVWDKQLRVGTTPVRFGGIGSVCTHPDARGKGYATAVMEEAVRYMKESGYPISCLFTDAGNRFYHRMGYRGVPSNGFRMSQWKLAGDIASDWEVTPFDEARDLAPTLELYQICNRDRSATVVRDMAYWKSGNVRARDVYPRLVARKGHVLGGYLTCEDSAGEVEILDVAHRCEPGVLTALAGQFLGDCTRQGFEAIHGLLPQRHPFVDIMLELGMGNLVSAGNNKLMLNTLNLQALSKQILPELQGRLDSSDIEVKAQVTVVIQVDGEDCVLMLGADRTLQLGSASASDAATATGADKVALSGELFWRMLLGESGWGDLRSTLRERGGTSISSQTDELMRVLLPTSEPVYWQADHF
jgi:predicted N-acetyltransferase YhbS